MARVVLKGICKGALSASGYRGPALALSGELSCLHLTQQTTAEYHSVSGAKHARKDRLRQESKSGTQTETQCKFRGVNVLREPKFNKVFLAVGYSSFMYKAAARIHDTSGCTGIKIWVELEAPFERTQLAGVVPTVISLELLLRVKWANSPVTLM